VDEYQNLDAGDESLARWKASLGLASATAGVNSGPKVALYTIDLFFAFIHSSPSLPS
jgi:Rho GDP-dissociation inhibitor